MESDDRKKTVTEVIKHWKEISEGARKLSKLYDEEDLLNDIQPAETTVVLPMSLDEWVEEIDYLIEKWEVKLQKI